MAEENKVAKKPTKKRKKRVQYGAGKLRAAREIKVLADKLVELHDVAAKFPALKDVFEKEIVRCKTQIASRLKRA